MKPSTQAQSGVNAAHFGPEMRRNSASNNNKDTFGGNLSYKPNNAIRIGYRNIHGFPDPTNSMKYDTLRTESGEFGYQFDLQSFGEVNRRWNILPHDKQFRALTKGWWDKPGIALSWLHNDDEDAVQYGGVATVMTHRLNSCKIENDNDIMGRWTWITLRGKRNTHTTIISAYRPVKSGAPGSVEAQQLRYLREHDNLYDDPIPTYDKDLMRLIQQKRDLGHKIFLIGDFNIRQDSLNEFTSALEELGMREVLIEKYLQEGELAPATFSGGRWKIDGAWATDDITILQGGHSDITDTAGGDHPWIWADIAEDCLLGGAIDPLTKPVSRRLSCKTIVVKERYQMLLENEYSRHNLREKLETILEEGKEEYDIHGSISAKTGEAYEKLATLSENAIKYADTHCKKVRSGKVPFSQKTKKLQGAIILWKEILLYKLRLKRNHRMIQRKAKRWDFTEAWRDLTIDTVKDNLRNARREYKLHKPRAWEERKTYLGKQANDMAERDDTGKTAEQYYRQLLHQEESKSSFQRIQTSFKPPRVGVNRVEKDNDDGTRTLICEKEAIEREIARANVEKLLQADNTPLRMEPLRTHFGEDGDFSKWNDIADGILNLPQDAQVDEGVKLWFNKIQSTEYTEQTTTWTADEYCDSWKKMDERITSLPGPAFSHFKAAQKGSIAAEVHSNLALIPMVTGYSPTRWCQSVASMIPKKQQDLRPAKLRLITLLHAIFNHNNKWVGKKLMEYGEHHDQLAREQYGSRKRKSSGQHALNKRLTLDFLRTQKIPAILIANDARSCYDRIIIMVSYLTMIMYGISRATAKCLLSCLIGMEYAIRTVFGDSDLKYGGLSWRRTPHGNGQGNGDGPGLWNGISSPLFNIVREQDFGMKIQTPISKTPLHYAGFGFVDDTDLIQTIRPGQTTQNLLRSSQNFLKLWEEVLRCTGGALDVRDKSDWTFINFQWQRGKWKLAALDPSNELEVRDHADDTIPMKQIPPTQARETLGVMQAPSGDETSEVEYLERKLKTWLGKLWASKLQRQDVTKAVHITIMRTLRYGLLATAMSYEQCDTLMKPLLNGALPKMGIVRTANRILATAETKFRGLGLTHLFVLQLVDHLKIICDHGGTLSDTGILLGASLEGFALQAGYCDNPLDIQPDILPWTEHCWWKITLSAITTYQIKINGTPTTLTKWTQNDSFIMKDFHDYYQENESAAFYQSLNRVRLYLRVLTRSDLTQADGRQAHPLAFTIPPNRIKFSNSSNKYDWPDQGRPPTNDLENWKIALDEVYGITPAQPFFRHNQRCEWDDIVRSTAPWLISTDKLELYQRYDEHMWSKWVPIRLGRTRAGRSTFIYRSRIATRELQPTNLAQVDQESAFRVRLVAEGRIRDSQRSNRTQYKRINGVPFDRNDWSLQHVIVPPDGGHYFAELIRTHRAKTCGDGSFKSGRSTGAFLGFTPNQMDIKVAAACQVHIHPEDNNAYCGELGGIQSAVAYVNSICKKHKITNGTVTHGVDNDAALTNCFGPFEPSTRTPCFHIVKRIRAEIAASPIRWKGKKVKGHQDKDKTFEELDCWGQANVLADKAAKAHWNRLDTSQEIQPTTGDTQGWTVCINGKTITKNFEHSIKLHCSSQSIKQYWCSRFSIDDEARTHIDWTIFGKSTELLTASKRLFITKHAAGISATGRNMYRRRERDTDQCPRCGESDEDRRHIFQCQADGTNAAFLTGMAELELWLKKTTNTQIETAITALVTAFRNNDDYTRPNNLSEEAEAAIEAQLTLGLDCFLCGILAKEWRLLQKKYIQDIASRRCDKKWASELTIKLIDLTYDMWSHRNDVLHNNDNTVRDLEHTELNDRIDSILHDLPSTLRMFSHAEQRFFRRTDKTKLKACRLYKKRNWIKKAATITRVYNERRRRNPQVRQLYRFLGINPADDREDNPAILQNEQNENTNEDAG